MILLVALLLTFSVISVLDDRIIEEPPICGKSVITNTRLKRSERQRNGSDSNDSLEGQIEYMPFVASVQVFDVLVEDKADLFNRRLTGAFVGNILGPTLVLVTCRCVVRHMGRAGDAEGSTWTSRQFGVMAGTPWDFSPVDGKVGQIRFASRIFVHPKCVLEPSVYHWDMAIMLLLEPFQFSKGILEPVPIPTTDEEVAEILENEMSRSCFTAGWDWAFNSHKPKNLKQKIYPLFIRNASLCNSNSTTERIIQETHLCVETGASFQRLRRTGDAGSPLVCLITSNTTVGEMDIKVLGIKSIEDTSTPDGFMLFARIDIGLDWIWNFRNRPPLGRGFANFNAGSLKVSLFLTFMKMLRDVDKPF